MFDPGMQSWVVDPVVQGEIDRQRWQARMDNCAGGESCRSRAPLEIRRIAASERRQGWIAVLTVVRPRADGGAVPEHLVVKQAPGAANDVRVATPEPVDEAQPRGDVPGVLGKGVVELRHAPRRIGGGRIPTTLGVVGGICKALVEGSVRVFFCIPQSCFLVHSKTQMQPQPIVHVPVVLDIGAVLGPPAVGGKLRK